MIYEKVSFSNIMKHVSNLKLRNEHMSFLNPNNNHGAEGLVAAVKIDDVILLDALLSYDSSLHPNGGVISNGETAIHTAARNGRVRCMRYLLRHLSNRTDRSGFIFRPRHDGEVPKRTALCATVGIDRDVMSSTQADYHNDCLEQLYCFGRDMMDITEYGPTSYENCDGPDISICSYLAAAMKSCANCASTFMYSSTMKFEDVNIANDIVAKLQDCVERSALTLRNERCGPSSWTYCLKLLSSCSARPIYREMRMITWIASKETVRFHNRDLISPWEDLADSNNNVVQDMRSNDNTVIIRLCRVGPYKGRDDVYVIVWNSRRTYSTTITLRSPQYRYVRVKSSTTVRDMYNLIRYLARDLKECPHLKNKTDVHILHCGQVHKCKFNSKDSSVSLNLRNGSLVQFSIVGCNCDAVLVKFKSRRRIPSTTEARELLENYSSEFTPSAPVLIPTAPPIDLKAKKEEENEEEEDKMQTEENEDKISSGQGDEEKEEEDKDRVVYVNVDTKSNVVISTPISPPYDNMWSVTMRICLSFHSDDKKREEPKVWSLIELETKKGEIWNVVCVSYISYTGSDIRLGLGLGLVRGNTVPWNSKSWFELSRDESRDKSKPKCLQEMPWLYRFYSLPVASGDHKAERFTYLTIVRSVAFESH